MTRAAYALKALRRAGYKVTLVEGRVDVTPVDDGQWLLARYVIEHTDELLDALRDEETIEFIRVRALALSRESSRG